RGKGGGRAGTAVGGGFFLRPPPRFPSLSRGALTAGAPPVSPGRVALSAWTPAAGDVCLQTWPHSGRGLSIAAQEHPTAVSSPDCSGVGQAVSRNHRDPT